MERKTQLDFLRGLFLIIITIDHFLVFNSVIRFFTYEFVGWVTAAEGFVFLSGLTAGLVYTHRFSGKAEQMVVAASRKRAWIIYRNHILLFLLVALIAVSGFGKSFWAEDYVAFTQKPVLAIIAGFFLVYQPKYMDILPMYFVFMLFVPVIIKAFRKGYIKHLLAGSIILYIVGFTNGCYNFTGLLDKELALETGTFNMLCWQLLFFMGLLLGYLYYNGKTQKWQVDRRLFTVSVVVVGALFVGKMMFARVDSLDSVLHYFAFKTYLGPLRLLNFAALASIITYAASKWPQWFKAKPINYLGRHSLEVFSFHILLLMLLEPFEDYLSNLWALRITNSLYLYPLGTLMIILLVVPALFLAPTLFSKRPYLFFRGGPSIQQKAIINATASTVAKNKEYESEICCDEPVDAGSPKPVVWSRAAEAVAAISE
ncbi:MAG: OpgC domain-containing protein [Janthinobacterium lividum]